MSIPDSGDFDHARVPYPAPQAPPPAGPVRLFRWYDLILIALIVLLSQTIPGIVVGIFLAVTGKFALEGDATIESVGDALSSSMILILVVGSGIVMGLGADLLRRMRRIDWATLGVRPTTVRALGAAVLAFVAYLVIAETIGRLMGIDPEGELARNLMAKLVPPDASIVYLVVAIAFIGFIVPVAEEVIFRGFLVAWLRERSNGAIAVVLSALIFAFVHFYFVTSETEFGLFATAQIFVLGTLLGSLAVWSRSLWPPILLHAINNIVAIVVAIAG